MKRALFRIAAVLCIALAAFFLMPVFGGILHFGMIWPAAVLLSAAAVLLRPDFFRRLLRPRWLRRAVSLLAAVCAAAVLVTLGMMAGRQGSVRRRTCPAPSSCWAVRCWRTGGPV